MDSFWDLGKNDYLAMAGMTIILAIAAVYCFLHGMEETKKVILYQERYSILIPIEEFNTAEECVEAADSLLSGRALLSKPKLICKKG